MNTTVNVHNIYTLYELNADGTTKDTPVLSFYRPQDWGDPSRWHYHWCRVEFSYFNRVYINNCHIWQQVERNTIEALQIVAPQLFIVLMPGQPWQLAGQSFLDGDDFWLPEWGEMPPYYEPDDEDYPPDELE